MARVMKAPLRGPLKRSHMVAPTLLGVELADHREEVFVIMVCDGMPMGLAFRKAGFTSNAKDAPSKLWALDRCQQRALTIFEARKRTGAVTLPQVTSMLERVFTSALHNENESAAHNAAFSLARLYGHVTDRAIVDVRRPSRDPDAPSEQALTSWVAGLIDVSPDRASLAGPAADPPEGPQPSAPAVPLGPDPSLDQNSPSNIKDLQAMNASSGLEAQGPGPENSNEINWLAAGPGGGSENGAPSSAVTGAPPPGGLSEPIGGARPDPFGQPGGVPTTPTKKRGLKRKKVPVKKRGKSRIRPDSRPDPFA